MRSFALLLTIFFVTSCNIKINPTYHYMSFHAVETTYKEALDKVYEIHMENPSYLVDKIDLKELIDHEDGKRHQTYFYLSETNQVVLCVFFGEVENYSLVIMTHYHDLDSIRKATVKDIINKDTYTQEEIDRYNKSKEIFQSQILDKLGRWEKIEIQDLKTI